MKFSAIEIGTNSTKFAIAELDENNSIMSINKSSTVNRLSGGMYSENKLSEAAIQKEIEIIGEKISESKANGASLLSIFSTSVLRDASNKQILMDVVKEKFGVNIKVISGEEEAYLAYTVCKEIVEDKRKSLAVIDIGGGSTEITVGKGSNIDRELSLNVGAVRLTEMFVKNDPISENEIREITAYIEGQMDSIELVGLDNIQLVGTGGSIKSLGTMLAKENYVNEYSINEKILKRSEISDLFEILSKMDIEKKKNIIGLNPKRADVIVTGVIILLTVMRKLNIEEIKISTKGVLEGFFTDYLQKTRL